MSTRKAPPRRKSVRKAKRPTVERIFDRKFPVRKDGRVDVDGHLLTPEQFLALCNDTLNRFDQMQGGAPSDREERALRLALDHLLWQHRPTSTAKEWLWEVNDGLVQVNSALMGMREYPFYSKHTGTHGIQVLVGLRADLLRVADCLFLLHEAMAAEPALKLHEIVEWRVRFDSLRDAKRLNLDTQKILEIAINRDERQATGSGKGSAE